MLVVRDNARMPLFRSGWGRCAVFNHSGVEDVATPTHVPYIDFALSAKGMPHFDEALHQGIVSYRPPPPYSFDKLVFANKPPFVFGQVLQHLISLWAQVDGLAGR